MSLKKYLICLQVLLSVIATEQAMASTKIPISIVNSVDFFGGSAVGNVTDAVTYYITERAKEQCPGVIKSLENLNVTVSGEAKVTPRQGLTDEVSIGFPLVSASATAICD